MLACVKTSLPFAFLNGSTSYALFCVDLLYCHYTAGVFHKCMKESLFSTPHKHSSVNFALDTQREMNHLDAKKGFRPRAKIDSVLPRMSTVDRQNEVQNIRRLMNYTDLEISHLEKSSKDTIKLNEDHSKFITEKELKFILPVAELVQMHIVISEEKYSFTSDDVKAATRQKRQKSMPFSISHLKIGDEIMSSEKLSKSAVLNTELGKRMINNYLARNISKLHIKRNLTLEVDSELVLSKCECTSTNEGLCPHIRYTTPVRATFTNEGYQNTTLLKEIKQMKGGPEMSQVDWLSNIKDKLKEAVLLVTFDVSNDNVITGIVDEETFLDTVKRMYCPSSVNANSATLEQVRQLSIKYPDKSFRPLMSWMPPKSELLQFIQLINCQMQYLLTASKHDADIRIGAREDALTLLEDDIRILYSKKGKKKKRQRLANNTPTKDKEGKRKAVMSTPMTQRQPEAFKDLGKTNTVKITYTREINSGHLLSGKCDIRPNSGRQNSITFSYEQGEKDVQNSIEIQCKDCNNKLLADIKFEKRCGFQKCEMLSPSGYTIAFARKRLHWSLFKLEMQDVHYILKKRSHSPLLIDVVNSQDRSVVAKLFEDLNSSLSSNQLTVKLVYQTELNLSKRIVILLITGALNMTFKQRKHSMNLKCSICSQCSKGTIIIMLAFIFTLMTMVAVLVAQALM
ncbi:unnamed protein product [Mytilus coruscus]|uniref:Uncharacterized protein n=1 Tax=Mytilus coruscus TaxID=42192 RepID=A0A6J8ANT8_MYTCO|nr:unnamed protein product [Mytilus coruscus]CAC5371195.1 unnamed protein product [Mytilus coruscus]